MAWQRTFGKVLGAWQDADENPHVDVAAVWDQLQRLHSGRNNVHLYRAIEDGSDFYDVLVAEEASLGEAKMVLVHLKNLQST